MKQAGGRRQLAECFLCNLDNTRAQQMNKPNYKFANSSNLRDAKKEFFLSFLRQESCQGKSQTRFGCLHISLSVFQNLGSTEAPQGGYASFAFIVFKFWHM